MWTLYGTSVDLTEFAAIHPGGKDVLMNCRGMDCTVLFEQYHLRSDRPMEYLKKFGVRVPDLDPFYADLREEVRKLKTVKMPVNWLWAYGVVLATWVGWVQGNTFACLVLPWLNWLWVANVSHNASHYAVSSSVRANRVWAHTSCPLVYNTAVWDTNHVIYHHVHTNEVNDVDLNVGMRVHPRQPACAYQHLGYMALALGASFALNFQRFGWQWLGSAWVLLYPVASGKGWCFALYPFIMTSIIFVGITQVSHIQAEAQRDRPYRHWTHAMVATSMDYSQSSKLWSFLTGGLNMQGLHHCIPHVNSIHYPGFYPTYRALCRKHGLAILEVPTWREAWREHWRHVTTMGLHLD